MELLYNQINALTQYIHKTVGVPEGITSSVLTTLVFIVAFYAARFIMASFYMKFLYDKDSNIKDFKFQGHILISREDVKDLIDLAWKLFNWLIYLAVFFLYLKIIFEFFPATENISDKLYIKFTDLIKSGIHGVIGFIPNIFILVILFYAARYTLKIQRHFFNGIKDGRINFSSFYPEWAEPTRKIVAGLTIIIFLVIAFPYLPGSNSPAFKGLSIFIGVLVSLGSSVAVANIFAGVLLTYMRAFSIGDRVRIADAEGDVTEKTLFVTRILTLKKVEITIPNLMVLNNHIINYSVQAKKSGLVLHTTVTIGYDVPRQKVADLLLQAARMTNHVEEDPAPFVLNKELQDFYVAYELNATIRSPKKMAVIYSEMHEHILDLFNDANIEIASPHLSSIRDGNKPEIPDEYLPKNFRRGGFNFFQKTTTEEKS